MVDSVGCFHDCHCGSEVMFVHQNIFYQSSNKDDCCDVQKCEHCDMRSYDSPAALMHRARDIEYSDNNADLHAVFRGRCSGDAASTYSLS